MTQKIETKEGVITIGTPEEALWKNVVSQTEKIIKGMEDELLVNRAVLDMAKRKLKEAAPKKR